ncbi:glyoxalase [Candidatus Gracilibacteria bacterium]|nr:glyoxalase [Candidatus Gracilibacteria bacterium]
MQIVTIHHVQITIPPGAEDAARAFYCDVLGLQEISKPLSLQGRGGFWLLAGKLQVYTGVEESVDRSATKAHIAYQVDALVPWVAHLAEAGIVTLDAIPIPGYNRCEFRDPFGNRVELIAPLVEG